MPQGYDGLPNYYLFSSNPITPNLGLSLKGMDPIVAEDFVLIDTAFGSVGGSIKVNGSVVNNPNFKDSATAVFTVVGSDITIAASGGTGTVTNFSAGALSPLFTTSVATPATTPALSFSLNTQNNNLVFAGPTSGGPLTPTFRALVEADLPLLTVNVQTGITYTFVDGDRERLVTFNNTAATAVTLPQAGIASTFLNGWKTYVENLGTGLVTITPTTSTINGMTAIVLGQFQSATIFSNGTNYDVFFTKIASTDQASSLSSYVANDAGLGAAQNQIVMRNINTGVNAKRKGLNIYLEHDGAQSNANYDGLQVNVGFTVDANTAASQGHSDAAEFYSAASGSGATVSQINAVKSRLTVLNGAHVNNAIGFIFYLPQVDATSTVDNFVGFYIDTPAGGGTVTNWCSVIGLDPGASVATTAAYGCAFGGKSGAVLASSDPNGTWETASFIGHANTSGGLMPFTLFDGWYSGIGTPEGSMAAVVGSIASRRDGGAGTSFYVKESGSGNTGWKGVLTSSTVLPATTAAVPHEWLASYNAATGAFTQTQPAVADLSDTPAAHYVLAGPTSGAAATATFRALVAADIPALAYLTNPMTTLGDIIYENAVPAADRLAGNTTTTKMYLSQTGTGAISAAPAWAQIAYADISGTPSLAFLPLAGGTMLGVLTLEANAAGLKDAAGSTGSNGNVLTVNASGYPVWAVPASPGVGTVTSFSAGDLSPLFTTSVATATSTPALTFSLSTQSANLVFAGPTSGIAAAPTFRALVAADIPSGATLWSALGNAAADLTLSNAGFKTEFDQTSAVAWLWKNTTTATVSTTNASPLLELAANYWNGASGADTWTLGTALNAGVNKLSQLVIAHSGSSGPAQVQVPINGGAANTPSLVFGSTLATGGTYAAGFMATNGGAGTIGIHPGDGSGNLSSDLRFYRLNSGTTTLSFNLSVLLNSAGGINLQVQENNNNFQGIQIISAQGTATGIGILLGGDGGGNNRDFNATSGASVGVSVGGVASAGRVQFSPTSGTATFVGLQVAPVVNQTGGANGAYTALKIAVTETAAGAAAGVNKIIDCYAGSTGTTQIFAVDNLGAIYVAKAAAAAPTSTSGGGTAGTLGQIVRFGGALYFCSVGGVAGAATWNALNMTAV